MKKNIVVLLIIIGLIIGYFILLSAKNDLWKLKNSFLEWDRGKLVDLEGSKVIGELENYLNNNSYNYEDIISLSSLLKIYKEGNMVIIQYIENPEYYGSSNRKSYHIALCNKKAKVISIDNSIKINQILSEKNNLYYVYTYDYKFSNIIGINIFKLTINENEIELDSALPEEIYIEKFRMINGSLYYDDTHIYYDNIKVEEVILNMNNKKFKLKMNNDGKYAIHDISL